jgi:II/X family phage/plasmid replication protein
MIDWVKVKLEILHPPISNGSFMVIDKDGHVENEILRPTRIQGSFESSVSARSTGSAGPYVFGVATDGQATHIEIVGNPSKFLQGHNVFGSDDLSSLVAGMCGKVLDSLGLHATVEELSKVRRGQFYINWIDINYSYQLSSQADVQAWIKAAEYKSRTRSGRPNLQGSTLYFQKNSRRWAVKFYSKALELLAGKAHSLPTQLLKSGIKEFAENLLRCEVRLLGKELRSLEITYGYDLTPEKIRELYEKYMSKVSLSGQVRIQDDIAQNLKPRLLATYTMWCDGHNLCNIIPKSKFYRDRKELMEYGVDIGIARDRSKTSSNVVPLIRILEATPVQTPDWAYDKGLIFSGLRSVK